ncbi:unnamed protein product [Acanthoscelides obtectus]|uniref:ZP domain-containing protein n=1 Tax=Acanthoscelides obtectus TaxID=200917 RepID=A0A9P0PX32_ACAOB|nr:unnamed protein product [Acanthoscelides obtectus]CAK1635922.1 hypothetical protein AOBTE_LOCUS9628 [Acanthoscelides obtectus]
MNLSQWLCLAVACLCNYASAQSNYGSQANNVEYIGEGLPPATVLDGKVTQLDDLSPVIFLNRTKAALNCAAGSMQVELKFNDKFYGLAYAAFERNSACQIHGKGGYSYRLELPLKGCGTKQDPQRVFTNNIVVRFHPSLEIDGDEIITIVCRYPPPIVPPPAALPALYQSTPAAPLAPPLKGFQILLIICGILFLSLMLLGLGCSYYCLRRRPVVFTRPFSSIGTDSEITKLSGSSIGNLSIEESIKIPRATVPVTAAPASSAGSEGPLMSDNLPSDYPSESHSEIDVDTGSLPGSSAGSYDNQAYVHETSTFYSETVATPSPPRLPIVEPKFDVQVDDVFLRTITEKKTIEDIERHKRLITEYHTRPKPVEDQKWDVTIKNYPEMPEPPEWENFSDVSSASALTLTPKLERANLSLPPQSTIVDNKPRLNAPEIVANVGSSPPRYTTTHTTHTTSMDITSDKTTMERTDYLRQYNLPVENPEVPNWDVLIRVFQPTEQTEDIVIESAETFNSQLTTADKMKWRQIITTESTLRTMLTECVVREDFERIRQDTRYTNLFEPPKWDVIIRILTPVDKTPKNKKKRGDWDNRSRRSSLPTLYEYDSDGGSSVRTLTREPVMVMPQRSRKSSYRSEMDLRSMSEVTVDFGRPDPDRYSEASSYDPGHPSLARSLSQPSLARSASEFTERWIAPSSRYDTASEITTPEGSPKSQRSSRFLPPGAQRSSATAWQVSRQTTGRPVPGSTAQMVTREYRSEATSSYVGTRNVPPSGDWFIDNDSEASYK